MLITKHPIGLLGGTFDPFHNGHLHIATQVLKELHLNMVHFIPSKQTPLKNQSSASAHHRLTMLRLGISGHPQFIANDVEIARPAPSYTYDTLTTLRSLIPKQPLCLIIGADAFNQLTRWFRWEDYLKLAHLVIVNRAEYSISKSDWQKKLLFQYQTHKVIHLTQETHGKIYALETAPYNISAMEIRQKIKNREDVSAFLPKKVWLYIQQHHLYF